AGQFSEIPGNYTVRDSASVAAGNPVLAAARLTSPVGRPSSTPDYRTLSAIIHTAVNSALPGLKTDGADPCTTLVNAAKAIDPNVPDRLTCPNAGGGGSP
ncbi:MAG: hypothetical protein ACRDVE_13875, partial [Actinocrinis sp.]